MLAGFDVGKLGIVPDSLPPGAVFIDRVHANTWADSQGVRPRDELVQIAGRVVASLDEGSFKALLQEVRPLQLSFSRRAADDAVVGHAASTLTSSHPISGSEKLRMLRQEAQAARRDYQAASTIPGASITQRFDDLELAWSELRSKKFEPVSLPPAITPPRVRSARVQADAPPARSLAAPDVSVLARSRSAPPVAAARFSSQPPAAATFSSQPSAAAKSSPRFQISLDEQVNAVLAELWDAVGSDAMYDLHRPDLWDDGATFDVRGMQLLEATDAWLAAAASFEGNRLGATSLAGPIGGAGLMREDPASQLYTAMAAEMLLPGGEKEGASSPSGAGGWSCTASGRPRDALR